MYVLHMLSVSVLLHFVSRWLSFVQLCFLSCVFLCSAVISINVFASLVCFLSNLLVCVCVCTCVWVCTGWHRRSTGSRSVSGKEHEPPGNAQKHQHRRHKHKSAKFTFLQIAAARSMNLELSADVYRDAICLPKLQITNFYQSGRYCVISHSMLWCYLLGFIVEHHIKCFGFFLFDGQMKYLSDLHSFCFTAGWLVAFSTSITDLWRFVTERKWETNTSVYFKEGG